jgi:hypothetical protein
VFRNELTACLALVAPVGMTEESRGEWLAVAWDTLKHIPPDILEIGSRKAREKCDHPAKVVPTIIAETASAMGLRSRMSEWDRPQLPAPERDICTPEEARAILEEVGLKSKFPSSR